MKMKETLSYQPLVLVRTNTTQKSFLRSATANNTHYSTVAHSSILPALNCFSKLWSSPKKHILRLSPKDDQSIMTLKRDFHMAYCKQHPLLNSYSQFYLASFELFEYLPSLSCRLIGWKLCNLNPSNQLEQMVETMCGFNGVCETQDLRELQGLDEMKND